MIVKSSGVDFKIKLFTVGGKRLKLTIWDTAGQERFRTLTSSYYRGAQGIILVYDVTRRETFTNLSDVWAKELDLYSTNQNCVKMLVGNKVDRESERAVSREEGIALAKEHGCLFLECSAKTRENVEQCFNELALKANNGGSESLGRRINRSEEKYLKTKTRSPVAFYWWLLLINCCKIGPDVNGLVFRKMLRAAMLMPH
ncbi:hypothetical protein RJ640_024064 [Escallonia rubra]|uniref:Ras-related protein RABC2a n=1 Tax=Escallonia rubra TaxID=112253 RepID=A0AA88UP91_9ASTE|nr:hypothetical protein RJ640_024064 [Escallonia rubra]